MTFPEDFKTRLKIAKSKIKREVFNENEKKGSFMGSALNQAQNLLQQLLLGQ